MTAANPRVGDGVRIRNTVSTNATNSSAAGTPYSPTSLGSAV
jgi:hypothetical protein